MYESTNKETEELVKSYIKKALDKAEKEFESNVSDSMYIYDYLLLSCIAMEINYRYEKWEEIGYRVCLTVKEYVERYGIHRENYSMISGYGYVCFCVNYYSKVTGRLKNFSSNLNMLLMEGVYEKLHNSSYDFTQTECNDYDCISGIAGNLYYLLDCGRLPKELYKKSIYEMIDYLVKLTGKHEYKGTEVYNFHIKPEKQFLDIEKKEFPNGNFNFGMSHGMVAPLTALSKAYARGYNDIEVKDAIVRLKKFYDEFRIEENGIWYWPSQLSYESFLKKKVRHDEIQYAASWCYGNTGVLCGLIITAANIGQRKEEEDLKKELVKAMSLKIDKWYLLSPAICHGYASLLAGKLLILNEEEGTGLRKSVETHVKEIIRLSEYSTKIAESFPDQIENDEGHLEGYIGEYSLLNGVTGIVACFAELLYGVTEYRKLLMIG